MNKKKIEQQISSVGSKANTITVFDKDHKITPDQPRLTTSKQVFEPNL
ncbi:MAG TPA: hypothetical protein PL029_05500 [Bacteroidia bacterium]|nr:hypothetical protein [Bacteroidia bacterium]